MSYIIDDGKISNPDEEVLKNWTEMASKMSELYDKTLEVDFTDLMKSEVGKTLMKLDNFMNCMENGINPIVSLPGLVMELPSFDCLEETNSKSIIERLANPDDDFVEL